MSITRINNNVAAIRATRNLNTTGDQLAQNIERLSTGLRINRAGDDAAGLTIRERLRTQIKGTDMAIQNGQNGISMVNTTEASLDALVSSLQRVRELAIQAGNTGTYDSAAIQAIQEEIFQHIDEVNRIANSARFSNRLLFTGDNANSTGVKKGQDDLGVHVSADPNASHLKSGTSILHIVQTQKGSEKLLPFKEEDGQAFFATGIGNATDIAVSTARFNITGTNNPALRTTALNGITFDGVSIVTGDTITFQGVLSDGKTPFAGSISVGALTMANLETSIQTAIDNAETALFGGVATNIPGSFVQTHVSLAASTFTTAQGVGRFRFLSAKKSGSTSTTQADTTSAPSLFDIDFSVITSAGKHRNDAGITRDWLNGQRVGGQIGNVTQAITGSTFDTGDFNIEVSDIVPPERRIVETTMDFRFHGSGAIIDRTISLARTTDQIVINGTFVGPIYTTNDTGIALANGDTITIQGSNVDGSTFQTIFTISTNSAVDSNLGDGRIATLGGLVDELNYRDRSRGVNGPTNQSSFEQAKATVTGDGKLRIIDDLADNSKTSMFMIVDDQSSTVTVTDRTNVIRNGNAEEATIRIDGGPRQRVRIGDQVELVGPEPTKFGAAAQRLIMRLGSGFRTAMDDAIFNRGSDTAAIEAKEYVGRLNSGPSVTFQNGDTNVFFESGSAQGVAESLMLDFDAILDITGPPMDGSRNNGMAILLSTVNRALNFQVGPFKGQDLQVNIPSLSASNLGYGLGSGRTISDIDVTTVEGANDALAIVDKALDQISRTRAALGAFTNRLQTTIESLSVSSENLQASESRISDVDFATEVSKFTSNQIVFQSGTSVLSQANFLPQSLLSLLG